MPVISTPSADAVLARTVGGSGPGLLLAHGAGGSVALNYGPILDGLSVGHTVVGIDYPGTGRSPRAAGRLSVDYLADQVIAAADAEGLQRFALAGFSLGGPVAIRAAAKHPDRVSALVLTATFAYRDARLDLAAKLWGELYEAGDNVRLSEFLTLAAFSAETLRSMPERQLRLAIEGLAGLIPDGTPEHVDLVRRVDVRADLAWVTAPTLVVSTTADPLVSPHLHEELAAGIAGARLARIDTGHLPFAERPEEWLGLITGFLAEHSV
ncbi:alpha/beta hydrolase fold protein [Catenulispora acidiphila DSM 44928]|uniref:Alpha/beta hydrolase fold protein n=1 Tax=Catenulispora acidiphila (strain DSM 44928 / JCM 14897 / NBRC 102108 / NRRL B-24433 / ID139908) TaxID=479433 RepID=C7Q0E1_CATAD|nr:alpha/beta hydrolase [Catenulispora acidiphila]ACU77474.1 alpha/beta hydrolase fold protein [Catenulispora acidiphila DSM 44928]